jgi:hypothetical protein
MNSSDRPKMKFNRVEENLMVTLPGAYSLAMSGGLLWLPHGVSIDGQGRAATGRVGCLVATLAGGPRVTAVRPSSMGLRTRS